MINLKLIAFNLNASKVAELPTAQSLLDTGEPFDVAQVRLAGVAMTERAIGRYPDQVRETLSLAASKIVTKTANETTIKKNRWPRLSRIASGGLDWLKLIGLAGLVFSPSIIGLGGGICILGGFLPQWLLTALPFLGTDGGMSLGALMLLGGPLYGLWIVFKPR
ncbi:MAG: hypothetical protein HQ596_02495 [Candidatus Saganbacteria bacterium]|nr:hypothetical protein [Candidatus Saganbacteria bacterium]